MNYPDYIEPVSPKDAEVSLLTAEKQNQVIGLLNALRGLEIQDYEIVWADGNVVARKIDKTREPGAAAAAAAGEVAQFRVLQVHKDHLICNSYTIDADGNETIGEDEIQIAKPYVLRATPWDGEEIDGRAYTFPGGAGGNGSNADEQRNPYTLRQTIIYSAPTISGTQLAFNEYFPPDRQHPVTLKERIWPEWIGGVSIIYASKVKERPIVIAASEVISSGPPVVMSEDVSCDWVDLNVDARRWEMIWRTIYICVDNGDGTSARKRILVRASEAFE